MKGGSMMCMLDTDDDHTFKRPTLWLEDEHEGIPSQSFTQLHYTWNLTQHFA